LQVDQGRHFKHLRLQWRKHAAGCLEVIMPRLPLLQS
jgi:hypothetical protein